MKKIVLFMLVTLATSTLFAQKYVTKSGQIKFFSEAAAENIEAVNKQVNSALDASTGEFVFKVLMKSFEFEKALMQEHFNENYVESDKFPNATFNGKVTNIKSINFQKDGTYEAVVSGDLTIHGVTKTIAEKGTFTVKGSSVSAHSEFFITLSEYNVKIPKAVVNNIAEKVKVTVDLSLSELKK